MSQIPIGWLRIEGCVYPFNKRQMMINGIPVTGPLTYFYQKDMIGGSPAEKEFKVEYENPTGIIIYNNPTNRNNNPQYLLKIQLE